MIESPAIHRGIKDNIENKVNQILDIQETGKQHRY